MNKESAKLEQLLKEADKAAEEERLKIINELAASAEQSRNADIISQQPESQCVAPERQKPKDPDAVEPEPIHIKPVNHDNIITQFRNWYQWRRDKENKKYTIKQRRIITVIKRASWLLALSAYCISFLLREMTPVPAYRISPRNVMTTPDYSIEIAIIVFIIVRMSIWVLKGFWVTDAKE